MADTEGRTEAATPTRLTKAESDGDGVLSREVVTFAALAAAAAVFAILLPGMAASLVATCIGVLRHAGTTDTPDGLARALHKLFLAFGKIVATFGVCVSGAAITATFLQTRLRLRPKAFSLHFSRLNPLTGLSNLLSMRHTIDSLQSIAKIGLIACAMYIVVSGHIHALSDQLALPAQRLPGAILRALFMMLAAGVATQALIAAVDYLWSKRQFSTRVQMSQEEIKDEQREIDGDPAVKAKLKMLRAQQAKRNLKAAMARATVVITNPTHYAVALEYHEGQTEAPRVIVKGADHMAARIREMARDLRVPIVPNPPLARALYKLNEEAEITPEHYKAVAEVIAYIWKLAQRHTENTQG